MTSSGNKNYEHHKMNDHGPTEREEHNLSSTPPRPSYSPVTPTIQPAVLAPTQRQQPLFMDEPPAVPISFEDNPDAIALRAAITILQMQRQQGLQDIRDLEKIKAAALQNPEAFLEDLKSGKLSQGQPTLTLPDEERNGTSVNGASSVPSGFGTLPQAQNVVRAPPINWAKYHVVGDSLEKLHEEQRRRPDFGEPGDVHDLERRSEHVITAPYDPYLDKLRPNSESDRGSSSNHK